jgi:hypothetical protein
MLTPDSFTLNSTITFDLYPAALLGNQINNVKVTAILDFATAQLYRNDLMALHQQVYPYLPQGTPNDPTQYWYIKVITPSGQPAVYGIPWIIDNTVQIYNGTSMQLTIDNVTPAQQNMIKKILSAAGFTAVNVTLVSTSTQAGESSSGSGSSSGATGS